MLVTGMGANFAPLFKKAGLVDALVSHDCATTGAIA